MPAMGQLSRKHRKNRGERYKRRKAAQAIRHAGNQGQLRWTPGTLQAALVKFIELDEDRNSIADHLTRLVNQHGGRTLTRYRVNPEWLLRMAEKEDGGCTSVGGLAVELGMYP